MYSPEDQFDQRQTSEADLATEFSVVESSTLSRPSALKPKLNFKQLRMGIAAFSLLLLVGGIAVALYISQGNQDIRNQASVVYPTCPADMGGRLACADLPGAACAGYQTCHLPGGYDSCDPMPGTNQCLYSYQGGQCLGRCPAAMPPGYKRCLCNNGVWTIGAGESCEQLCTCTGNDCSGKDCSDTK